MTPERQDDIRDYYETNPLMVSSPFGGVEGVNVDLLHSVFDAFDIDLAGRSVLDVGCGRGFIGDFVAERGGRYTGVDLVASRPGAFTLALADGAALPFANATFDRVFCIDVFEHFPNRAHSVAEFRRVLKPGGQVFLSAPNYGNVAGLVKWWCETFGRYDKDTWAPFRNWQPQVFEAPLTARAVRTVFEQAGFTTARTLSHAPEVGLGLCPWIDHPRTPEAIKFRLQRLFARLGPPIARTIPTASLHLFWRFDAIRHLS